VPAEAAAPPPTTAPPGASTEESEDVPHKKTSSPLAELFDLPSNTSEADIQGVVNRHMEWVASQWSDREKYTILFLHDDAPIDRSDADRIYSGLSQAPLDRPILLVLQSPGGDIASAYFIGKLCREYTKALFEVAVPRQAKSAATLICCAADRIHMGSLSELGPIDPQIREMPALAVKHSLEHLSELAVQYPGARGMLSDYLSKTLPIETLGYYERAARSAAQYAESLLQKRTAVQRTGAENAELARKLVYDYKDHGFAIDAGESAVLFGEEVIVNNSSIYEIANKFYQALNFIEFLVRVDFGRVFSYTGLLGSGAWVRRRRNQ
jgi:hypothetical protein